MSADQKQQLFCNLAEGMQGNVDLADRWRYEDTDRFPVPEVGAGASPGSDVITYGNWGGINQRWSFVP